MTIAPRFVSASLQLSGNAYADCGNPTILNNLQSYTLEVWIKLSTLSGFQSVIGKANLGVDAAYHLYVQDGYPVAYYPTPPYVIMSNQRLTEDTWHHLATTYDHQSGALTLYVDGNQVAQQNFAYHNYRSNANVLVGAILSDGQPDWFLQGMVGRTKIWGVVRDREQIIEDSVKISLLEQSVAEPLLLADFDFSKLPFVDLSGNNSSVTLKSGASYCLCVPRVNLQNNGYVNCGHASDLSLSGTKPYTIEGWFCPTGTDSGVLISKYQSSSRSEYQVSYGSNQVVAFRNSDHRQIASNATINPGEYYHFAVTYDSNSKAMSLYINGNLQVSEYFESAVPAAEDVDVLIGASHDDRGNITNFFKGDIQNIRIWNVCLRQADIRQWMYNQPVEGSQLIADFDFSVTPPVDTTDKHSIELKNEAQTDYRMITVTPTSPVVLQGLVRSYTADYYNPVPEQPAPHPAGITIQATEQYEAFSEGFKQALWTDLQQRHLRGVDEAKQADLREQFERAYQKAQELMQENPDLLKAHTIIKENGMVRIIHHTTRGDFVILEEPAGAIDDCTLWWIDFIFKITVGFFQALGLVPGFGDIAKRVYNLVVRNVTALSRIQQIIGGTITVTAGIGVIKVLYDEGLLWPILKLAFTSAGWWALVWVLKKAIAIALGLEAAELLANFIVWAAQLTTLSLQYHSSCSNAVFEAKPTPALA
jgi:hypothetical protein